MQLEWNGGIRVNGAACGALRMMASTTDPAAVPEGRLGGPEVLRRLTLLRRGLLL